MVMEHPEWKIAIEQKIKSLEKLSSIEYVPVFAERSASYREHRMMFILFFFVSGFLSSQLWITEYMLNLGIAVASGVASALLLNIERLARVMIPNQLMQLEVEEAAYLSFLRNEVFATKKRNGVLIFVSEFEHAVFILADKGLASAVPESTWADLSQRLASDFERNQPGETFFAALDSLHQKLAGFFPPEANGETQNELTDTVRKA